MATQPIFLVRWYDLYMGLGFASADYVGLDFGGGSPGEVVDDLLKIKPVFEDWLMVAEVCNTLNKWKTSKMIGHANSGINHLIRFVNSRRKPVSPKTLAEVRRSKQSLPVIQNTVELQRNSKSITGNPMNPTSAEQHKIESHAGPIALIAAELGEFSKWADNFRRLTQRREHRSLRKLGFLSRYRSRDNKHAPV